MHLLAWGMCCSWLGFSIFSFLLRLYFPVFYMCEQLCYYLFSYHAAILEFTLQSNKIKDHIMCVMDASYSVLFQNFV